MGATACWSGWRLAMLAAVLAIAISLAIITKSWMYLGVLAFVPNACCCGSSSGSSGPQPACCKGVPMAATVYLNMSTAGGGCVFTDYPLFGPTFLVSHGNGQVTLDCGSDLSGNPIVALAIWSGGPRTSNATIYWIPFATSCTPHHWQYSGAPQIANGVCLGPGSNETAVIDISE
jgi:hypothetical protein